VFTIKQLKGLDLGSLQNFTDLVGTWSQLKFKSDFAFKYKVNSFSKLKSSSDYLFTCLRRLLNLELNLTLLVIKWPLGSIPGLKWHKARPIAQLTGNTRGNFVTQIRTNCNFVKIPHATVANPFERLANFYNFCWDFLEACSNLRALTFLQHTFLNYLNPILGKVAIVIYN